MDHMAADTGPEQTMPSSGVGALEEEGRNGIGNRTETGEGRQKEYGKELTVDVEVEGTAVISMMDILREVKVQCGVVSGCRVRGKKNFEITMKDEVGKRKLLDGVRVKGALVHGREIVNNDMVVSFIDLPVYMEDATILRRLEEWGVRPISAIKRRKWPGTEIVDGTRFLKVRFNEQVTDSRDAEGDLGGEAGGGRAGEAGGGRGEEAGGSQVRVCRLCIKPGHIFRECPDFKCFRCQKTGHYARECEERNAAAREEEERGEQMEEKDGESDDGRGAEEEAEGGNEEAERELEWRYLTAATVLRRTVMPCQTRGRLQEELRTL
ncbi:uncharacterized protein LOC133951326 isoform X1 [Platichthys flesus]|uniref:uncharacterized protein LOC133951326 isoform X1 n=1 Tax=Platichthys flesus TaxID=8260 RepID=UPI001A7F79B7|nr:uncharacterized protein LOC133951326 isoform X1 [Platichthys flesus]